MFRQSLILQLHELLSALFIVIVFSHISWLSDSDWCHLSDMVLIRRVDSGGNCNTVRLFLFVSCSLLISSVVALTGTRDISSSAIAVPTVMVIGYSAQFLTVATTSPVSSISIRWSHNYHRFSPASLVFASVAIVPQGGVIDMPTLILVIS